VPAFVPQRAAVLAAGPYVSFLGSKGGQELKTLQMACGAEH
jgi:hypothetical protein